jgi:hypothetical protein
MSNLSAPHVKISVPTEAVEDARKLYAPSDHEVFALVPPDFATVVQDIYSSLGKPVINVSSVWDIYAQLHCGLLAILDEIPPVIFDQCQKSVEREDRDAQETDNFFQRHASLQELVFNPAKGYLGGVNNGAGPGITLLFLFADVF